MVEKSDMLRLTKAWTSFVPVVYEGYPHLLAEMYAYSMGAAHERLPHLQVDHYMVSNTDAGGEGWQWVDLLEDVCAPPQNGIYFPGKPLPTFAHHCQFYRAGEMGFQKRRIPHNIFSCESPLLLEPPVDLGFVDYKVNDAKSKIKLSKQSAKRNAFMLCVLHRSVNAAALDFKQRMCSGNNATVTKSINLLD
eukprot:gene1000-1128_t